jgi:hypothetical protein
MPGTIKLIMPNGTRAKEVHYYSTKSWKAIIDSWIILYGNEFENFHVHIRPEVEKTVNHKNFKIVKYEP